MTVDQPGGVAIAPRHTQLTSRRTGQILSDSLCFSGMHGLATTGLYCTAASTQYHRLVQAAQPLACGFKVRCFGHA